MKTTKRIKPDRPSLWYSEILDDVRILYPSGRVEYFSTNARRWQKFIFSKSVHSKAVYDLTLLNEFVSYI